MTILLCTACAGRKKVAPLGGIEKDCKRCLGMGYETVQSVDIPVDTSIDQSLSVKKRIKHQLKQYDTRAL